MSPPLPQSRVPGLVPTLNNTGWMTEALDAYSHAFTAFAAGTGGECLDIGCAYGVATLPALAGGAHILACDIDPRHLEILESRVPAQDQPRLRTRAGAMPHIDFPEASFDGLLCARALHFLRGEDIELTVRKMYAWLKPGGRAFLIADTPYVGPWWLRAPEYERRKAAGDPWPGLVEDYRSMLPDTVVDKESHPAFIHPLDPDILKRVAAAAGFTVLESSFLAGSTRKNGTRDHAGVIAQKA